MQCSVAAPLPVSSIVLLGRSGSGKSTLINMITNLLMDKNYEDERLVAIPQMIHLTGADGKSTDSYLLTGNVEAFLGKKSGNGQKSQDKQSQTQDCEYYSFITEECRLVLLDTPGMVGDGGIDKDIENSQKILNAIGSMGEIHGIVIVHKADGKRVDDSTEYMLGELQTLLSREVMENVFVALTHHTESSPQLGVMDVFNSAGIVPKKVFTFDNDCFIPMSIIQKYHKDMTGDTYHELKKMVTWNRNKKTFMNMFEILKNIPPKLSTNFKLIATNKAVLFEVGFKVGDILTENNSIELYLADTMRDMANFKKIAEQNKNYNYIDQAELKRYTINNTPKIASYIVPTCTHYLAEKGYIHWKKVPMPEGQKCTTCFTCKFSCHENCYITFQEVDGTKNFMDCTAFNHSPECAQCKQHKNCQRCTHDFTYHGHRKYRYERTLKSQAFDSSIMGSQAFQFIDLNSKGKGKVYDIRTALKVNEEMKARNEKACKDLELANQNIAKTQKALSHLNEKKDSFIKILAHLYHKITDMALSPINNFYEEHIKTCKQQITDSSDTDICPGDKEKQIAGLDRLLHAYHTIVNAARDNNEATQLSQAEIMYVNKQIAKIYQREEEIYKEYGRVYKKAAELEGLDCRKKI